MNSRSAANKALGCLRAIEDQKWFHDEKTNTRRKNRPRRGPFRTKTRQRGQSEATYRWREFACLCMWGWRWIGVGPTGFTLDLVFQFHNAKKSDTKVVTKVSQGLHSEIYIFSCGACNGWRTPPRLRFMQRSLRWPSFIQRRHVLQQSAAPADISELVGHWKMLADVGCIFLGVERIQASNHNGTDRIAAIKLLWLKIVEVCWSKSHVEMSWNVMKYQRWWTKFQWPFQAPIIFCQAGAIVGFDVTVAIETWPGKGATNGYHDLPGHWLNTSISHIPQR